jgi:hypothetical protein
MKNSEKLSRARSTNAAVTISRKSGKKSHPSPLSLNG